VARDYPGFWSYFAAHRQYFTSDHAWQQLSDMVREAKDKIPMSLAARVFQWELLHPEEPIDMPKVLRDELSEAHKLMGQATNSPERGAAAESIRDRFEAAFVADKDDDDDGDGGDKKKPGPGDVEIGMPYEYRGEKVENESKAEGPPGDGSMSDLRDWKGGTDQIKVKPSKQYGGLVAGLRGRIRALMAQLKLRNEAKRMDEHGLKRGRLDEGSIYKLGFTSCGFADEGLFEQEEIKETPDIAVGLLVDESGSMNGENIHQARALAIMLAEALAGLKGVHFCVMGHSGQGQVHGKMCEGLALSHYFTPDNPHMSSMARIAAFSQNLDGFAIAEVAKNVLRWYPKCQTKLVIHLSDGQPSANGYGGPSAMAHMGEVSAKARRDGIQVLGIGVQAFNEEEGTRMYGPRNFVIVQSMAQSVLAISKLVRDAVLRDTL
jgi:cobalamin biosynthesis protein CobT